MTRTRKKARGTRLLSCAAARSAQGQAAGSAPGPEYATLQDYFVSQKSKMCAHTPAKRAKTLFFFESPISLVGATLSFPLVQQGGEDQPASLVA